MAQPANGPLQSILRIRWALVGLAAVLAVFLIAHGNVGIGALIGIMTILRVVMLTKWQQRRNEMRRRDPGRFEQGHRD